MPKRIWRAGSRLENSPIVAAVVIVLVVSALFTANIVTTRRVAIADAERTTANFSRLLAEHAARTIDAIERTLEAAGEIHSEVRAGRIDETEACRRMRELQAVAPMLRNLVWTDAEGRAEVASTSPVLHGVSVADREYFVHHLQHPGHTAFIGQPVRARGGADEWVVPISRRLETSAGSFDGIVAGIVEPAYFASLYQALDLGPSGTVVMLRDDGAVLAREPDGARYLGTGNSTSSALSQHGGQAAATFRGQGPLDNTERIISYRRVPGYPLEVSVAVATSAVLGTWRTDVWGKLSLLGVLLVALIWGAFLVRRRALAEVRHLYEIEAARSAAEQASRAKSTFLSSMSHELRTPLNAILGFSDLLLHNIYGALNQKQREGVGDIADAGRHLLQLINNLLDISKIEAGGMKLRIERLDPVDAIEDALRLVRTLAADAGVMIERDMQVTPLLLADRQALHQILVNLLSNGVKFTPRGGTVTARLARTSKGLIMGVADTGVGIPAGDVQRVLEPYVQVEPQTIYQRGQRGQGTGLGLPIAKQLTELHGADFTLESVEGQGTTVTMVFPLHRLVEPDELMAKAS